jgi:hypothetical protein
LGEIVWTIGDPLEPATASIWWQNEYESNSQIDPSALLWRPEEPL